MKRQMILKKIQEIDQKKEIVKEFDWMKNEEFVNYEPYHEVNLTKDGIELAKELNRHSRLLELLLHYELGLDQTKAHNESDKFSLLFSCETINKICEKYDHPEECPCGEKILSSSVCCCEKEI